MHKKLIITIGMAGRPHNCYTDVSAMLPSSGYKTNQFFVEVVLPGVDSVKFAGKQLDRKNTIYLVVSLE